MVTVLLWPSAQHLEETDCCNIRNVPLIVAAAIVTEPAAVLIIEVLE
jgi:hypothetical protein